MYPLADTDFFKKKKETQEYKCAKDAGLGVEYDWEQNRREGVR